MERQEKQLSSHLFSQGENSAKISRKIRSAKLSRRSRPRRRGLGGGIARGNTCRRSMNASSVFAYPLRSPAFLRPPPPPPPPSSRSFCAAITPQRLRIARARAKRTKGRGEEMKEQTSRKESGIVFRDDRRTILFL